MMTLYGYWRSSASYRVRIALGLKGIEVEHKAVNLKLSRQHMSEHVARNPQALVPVLELEDGQSLTQSLSIIEYLDDVYPAPPLMPSDPLLKAKVKSASQIIAADIAPIQNLRVLRYVRAEHGQSDEGVKNWAAHWIYKGFEALQWMGEDRETKFFMTDTPSQFECCLIPQIYNARRWGVNMNDFPVLLNVEEECMKLDAFLDAAPEAQHDAYPVES